MFKFLSISGSKSNSILYYSILLLPLTKSQFMSLLISRKEEKSQENPLFFPYNSGSKSSVNMGYARIDCSINKDKNADHLDYQAKA